MLDVLHYYFEEDQRVTSAEEGEGLDRMREKVYELFYSERYKYSSTKAKSSGGVTNYDDLELMSEDEEEKFTQFDPLKQPPKAYVPPTVGNAKSPKPFGALIDEPFSR